MFNMELKSDCKHFLAYKPCKYHKIDGRLCKGCGDYSPVKSRILIIKLDALGDVLRTTSILPLLSKKYPDCEITWITRENAIPLIKSNPYIDRIFSFESNYIPYLTVENFDVGICLDADPKSASILTMANCDSKYGFIVNNLGKVITANKPAEHWYHMGVNDLLKVKNRRSYHLIINEICELDAAPHKPVLKLENENFSFAKKFSKEHQLTKYSQIIGINTGGGMRWEYKKWLKPNYIDYIKLLKTNHPDIGILLLGGPEEVNFNQDIIKEVGHLVIDAGCHNSLLNFGALLSLCDVHFTTDSLGMHLSIAQNITTIVIVGPTSPWELDVFGNGEIIYPKDLECVACYRSTCDKKITCMKILTPELIYEKTKNYIT